MNINRLTPPTATLPGGLHRWSTRTLWTCLLGSSRTSCRRAASSRRVTRRGCAPPAARRDRARPSGRRGLDV
eukprot:scaffold64510_cov59-Phaeocystis_antarctica.AAC.2